MKYFKAGKIMYKLNKYVTSSNYEYGELDW